jgi:hypothetical protein
MNLLFHDISIGAMTAATAFGSAASAVGGGAVGAVATAATTMGTVASQVGASVAHVGVVASATSQMQHDLVQQPVAAAAKGIGRSSLLARTASVLSKTLPWVAIGASTLSAASVVQQHGAEALFTSRQGRAAVLGAVGGALLLVPTPFTQIAAAATLGALAVNEFGGMDGIDRAAAARHAAA